MNFDGFDPNEITRFSSLVEQDDPTNLPLGVSPEARNVKFHLTSARTRDGFSSSIGILVPGNQITGLGSLKANVGANQRQAPILFTDTGGLWVESPAGSGFVVNPSSTQVTPPTGSSMQVVGAFKKGFLAFTNLLNAKGQGAVYNIESTGLDPLSMMPVGQPWTATTDYEVGEFVTPASPIGGNGHLYRCIQSGTSGTFQPAFPASGAIFDGSAEWLEFTPVMSSSAATGNICTGLRYMVTLFVNRNGYISGMSEASVVSFTVTAGSKQLTVSPVPIGPDNTAARILAFTPAGLLSATAGNGISSAGPYFWIPPAFKNGVFDLSSIPGGVTIADVVNGVQETSTLINDNTTNNVTLNFDDNFLKQTLLDVSAYFQKIEIPPVCDVYYSTTLRRMFYATDNLPSGWYVSLQDDPESVYGDTGILQVAENNGENRVAIRDFKGILYAMKERSGHVITPSTDDLSTWGATKQWEGSGPCGFRAVDTCTTFMCYVHRSGVWIFTGTQPIRISTEIPVTWSTINWAAQHTIWVMIDDETREIRIGVPTGSSKVPNIILKLNYEESPDFSRPIHFSPFIGKEIASGECYKWSIDTIAANLAVRAERKLVNPPAGTDLATTQSQILLASSNRSVVSAIIPNRFDDDGAGIDSVIETACPPKLMKPTKLGGVQANIDGFGQIPIEILALRTKDPADGGVNIKAGTVIPLKKQCTAGIPFSCGARGQNERYRIRVSNGAVPGAWFDVKWMALMNQPISSARPG